QVQILRSLKLAVYSDQNVGHFGLGKELYTHFTSPIRRYPDLVVHRILKRALAKQPPLPWTLPEIGDHCSERERRAEEAERDLLRWRIYRLLKEKLGEEMLGMVVDITPEGLVVELQDYFVDGFLPYEEIPEPVRIRWKEKAVIRRRGGPVYELGDIIKVVIALVDPFRQKMRLALPVKKRRPR
ncbi:MAG: RNB domain-containing ribonuclease, partial [Candidatus Aminicenantes bacterium]|nr:RNB domain-containing ribonuclease [Candidatus Aminicenantes bacterium]